MVQKIMHFYMHTGGGHFSIAKSLSDYLSTEHNAKNILVDALEESPDILRKLLVDGYKYTQRKAKIIYKGSYALHDKSKIANLQTSQLIYRTLRKSLKKKILEEKPDKIVITHALLIIPIEKILSELGLDIPSYILVMDPFSAPSVWFTGKHSNYILFSDLCKEKAIHYGIDPDLCHIFSYPLHKNFTEIPSQKITFSLRKKYDLSPQEKVILIIGGGDGMPNGEKIVRSFVRHAITGHRIIFVAGKNIDQYVAIEKIKKKYPSIPLTLYGFTDKVKDLMTIADIIITKGGPATIFEILVLGNVPLSHRFIWGQEKGNVDFIVKEKLGFYLPRVSQISKKVAECLSSPEILDEYKKKIKEMKFKNGIFDLGDFIFKSNK